MGKSSGYIKIFTIFKLMYLLTVLLLLALTGCSSDKNISPRADSIYFNGKIATVDSAFSIVEAVAIKGDRFLAVGTNKEIMSLAGPDTRKTDLRRRTVVPGLIEAHAHPERASLSEDDGPLPELKTVADVLKWVRKQAGAKKPGEWIIHPKLFATRLDEMRPPTLAELDSVAPNNPVFLNGSYGGSLNSAAMRASGITPDTGNPGLLRDPVTGRLNGKIQFTALDLVKLPRPRDYTIPERAMALSRMFARYNQAGFTGVTSGGVARGDTLLYRYMKDHGMLTIRAFLNISARFPFKDRPLDEVRQAVDSLGSPTGSGNEWIRIGALKTTIDGGILTGTAYMREPWGPKAREIFGITDPSFRGLCRLTADELAVFVQAGAEKGWKMTAHCTGGGGVDLMLDAYEKVDSIINIRPLRCSIIHGNFFTPQSMSRMRKLVVIADMQPVWFYKDGDAMFYVLGEERMRTFHPYRSLIDSGIVVSAGSDHMVGLDDRESINPYNPWLALYAMVTRKTERGTVIMPEEAISREQALRCYTINNAFASFEEKLKGSIETGKLADMVVLENDYLTCPEEEIKEIKVKTTVLGGEVIYER